MSFCSVVLFLSVFVYVEEGVAVFIMYIVSVVYFKLFHVFYTFKMCRRVHTPKYAYMLKILIFTGVQINFLEEGFLIFFFSFFGSFPKFKFYLMCF